MGLHTGQYADSTLQGILKFFMLNCYISSLKMKKVYFYLKKVYKTWILCYTTASTDGTQFVCDFSACFRAASNLI